MEQLAHRDIEAFLSFVRKIYGHLDLKSFATQVVSDLPGVIPSDLTLYSEVDPRKRTATWAMEPLPPGVSELASDFEHYVRERPRVHHHDQRLEALRISDFLARSRFQKLRFYDRVHRMIGAEHRMTTELPTSPPLQIGIFLSRSGEDFSERDRLLLDMLRPHLAQAHRNAGAATEMRAYLDSTRHAVEELDRGVVVLTPSCRVQWCTDRARRLLVECFGPFGPAGQLPQELRRWVERQRILLSANGGAPPLPEPLIVERLGQRLVVRFVTDTEENRNLLLVETQALPFSAGTLRSLGLTRREAEILLWIARGKTNTEVAKLLYISPRTVKKHLEHIYQKLEVERRTEAVSRALEIFGLV